MATLWDSLFGLVYILSTWMHSLGLAQNCRYSHYQYHHRCECLLAQAVAQRFMLRLDYDGEVS